MRAKLLVVGVRRLTRGKIGPPAIAGNSSRLPCGAYGMWRVWRVWRVRRESGVYVGHMWGDK